VHIDGVAAKDRVCNDSGLYPEKGPADRCRQTLAGIWVVKMTPHGILAAQ
jgi:hypothetical protein